MNNVTGIVAVLRQQAELEFRILAGRAVWETAGALQRTPEAVSVRDVTALGGSH